jgi:hypothetical protein
MPDITMCPGDGCTKKDTCYRHTAEPNPYRQSWFFESPWEDGNCVEYIKASRPKKVSDDKTASV